MILKTKISILMLWSLPHSRFVKENSPTLKALVLAMLKSKWYFSELVFKFFWIILVEYPNLP